MVIYIHCTFMHTRTFYHYTYTVSRSIQTRSFPWNRFAKQLKKKKTVHWCLHFADGLRRLPTPPPPHTRTHTSPRSDAAVALAILPSSHKNPFCRWCANCITQKKIVPGTWSKTTMRDRPALRFRRVQLHRGKFYIPTRVPVESAVTCVLSTNLVLSKSALICYVSII